MGLFDKLKAAVNFVSGGAAKVSIEYSPTTAVAGSPINVKVTVLASAEVKSKGIYIDLRAVEKVSVSKRDSIQLEHDLNLSFETFEQEFKIAEDFVIAKDETKVWEGSINIPPNVEPSLNGKYVSHDWELRGRVEAKGNDPDSGFKPIKVNPA